MALEVGQYNTLRGCCPHITTERVSSIFQSQIVPDNTIVSVTTNKQQANGVISNIHLHYPLFYNLKRIVNLCRTNKRITYYEHCLKSTSEHFLDI